MDVKFAKDGTEKVSFRKFERDTLYRAAVMLKVLGRSIDSEDATKASALITSIMAKLDPQPVE